jgi:hypothetical protein
MPMTNAQRQKRYRERNRDDLAHITLDVRVAVRDRLDRLAWHFDWSLTQLVEELGSVRNTLSKGSLRALRSRRTATPASEDTADPAGHQVNAGQCHPPSVWSVVPSTAAVPARSRAHSGCGPISD